MRRNSALQPTVTMRDRILEAAILRFARSSYEETGLRDVAADVGVDVAYVHRCFGSKQRLFASAVAATIEPSRFLGGTVGDLPCLLARQVCSRDGGRRRDEVQPLDIVIRSLSSPEASQVLREFILKGFVDPLAERLERPAATRAALIAAFLTGAGILRNVIGIEPLCEAAGGELENLIATAIEGMMTSVAGPA